MMKRMEITDQPAYLGIWQKKNKTWVSEIRVPKSQQRIWLGTFETPEMAATTHDIAVVKLRGQKVSLEYLNFPANLEYYLMHMPASTLPEDIRAAAVLAMAAYTRANSSGGGTEVVVCGPHGGTESSGGGGGGGVSELWLEDINEEEMLHQPKMMADMASAMPVSPPQTYMPILDDEGILLTDLWSYEKAT